MRNITISLDEETLRACREYAARHRTSLNALIRQLLVHRVRRSTTGWIDEMFAAMDQAAGRSRGGRWRREDLYDE